MIGLTAHTENSQVTTMSTNLWLRRIIAMSALIIAVIAVVFTLKGPATQSRPGAAPINGADHYTVLITGSNRGIGLALVHEYAERGWNVIATARRPVAAKALNTLAARNSKVQIEKLDVTSDQDIAALVNTLEGRPIDVLLNNAGSNAGGRGQKFGELDFGVFEELMQVNAIGPLKMAEAFLPNVMAGEQKKIVAISSIQASILKTYGGGYAYRASKTALNMVMRTLSRDLSEQGVIVGILAPGIVATDMTKGIDIPMITAEESARGLADVIDSLTLNNSGQFIQYDGAEMPW